MNEYIAELLNLFSFEKFMSRSWLDITLILAPSVILIFAVLGYLFFLKTKKWKFTIYATCLTLTLVFLPYELLRQSAEMSRADANIEEIHGNLHELLNAANISHLDNVADKGAAAEVLDEMIHGLDKEKKKDLILISWLMAENDKLSLNQMDNRQQSLADEIKSSLSHTKTEIIDSRTPVEKISDNIVQRLDEDINYLIENKMQAFKLEIDNSLDTFQQGVNSFVQTELDNYEGKLTAVTELNIEELRNYSNKAQQAFAQQASRANKESLQRLDDTQQSIDGIGAAIGNINLEDVIQQVNHIANSVERSQKKNNLMFEYNECLRSITLFDLSGQQAQCKETLDEAMGNL
jgi:hypothetical protein